MLEDFAFSFLYSVVKVRVSLYEIASFKPAGPATVFVSQTAWNGTDGCWERCAEVAEAAGAEVIVGDWPDETLHRRTAMKAMKERGHAHILIPDGDEIVEPRLLDKLCRIAQGDIAGAVRVHMATYWKSPRYVIQPPETLAPLLLLDARVAVHDYIREYDAGSLLILGAEHGVLHHLSYAGPNERIQRKLSTWGHRQEVAGDWYRRVWQGWDRDPFMRDLHPTHPTFYGHAERIELPDVLRGVWDERPVAEGPQKPKKWPKLSVVIPLYGGPDDITHCLDSLNASADLIHEVIVVDDRSPDDAAETVKARAGDKFKLTLLLNEENLGFAATCNRGHEASSGSVVLFLNSDTRVPRAGLIRLIESLMSSGTVGAAGPYTNNAGYHQRFPHTYTSIEGLDLFARDFADRDAEDLEVQMLVGFCLAVRRSAIEELDEPPFDERFGRGLFEDNDLCQRLLIAGYSLRLASRAYIHHEASKSLERMDIHPCVLLRRNQLVYQEKYRQMLESGFVSHLAGQSSGPMAIRRDLHPERLRKRLEELAQLADGSLCMIVKDEERVLGECLRSVQGVFTQIVVVDTGSSDRTKEIALELGAEVYDFPWSSSFSEARNESLRHARGRFVMWMDADDTLPKVTAEAVLQAALSDPHGRTPFVVPVQFVEEGPEGGTRVDHVKLFPNLPEIRFCFHIHEQILPSLRALGLQVARIDHPVLHSGYDTSALGQKKKRERDWPLLRRDLEENPDHPFVLFNCGMTSFYEDKFAEATDYLSRCILVSDETDSHVRKAYALLGMAYRKADDSQKALNTLLKGLEVVGEDPELRFQAALVMVDLGRKDEAAEMYLGIKPEGGEHFSSIDIGIVGYKRSFNLGTLYLGLGRYAEAREWLLRAIEQAPARVDAPMLLFDAAIQFGDTRTAAQCAETVRRVLGPGETWAGMRVRISSEAGEPAFDALSRLSRENPGAEGPALLLSREFLAAGDERQAAPILKSLAANGCSEALFHLGVMALRRGDAALALRYTRQALQLDPGHEQTRRQLEHLEAFIASQAPKEAVSC